MVKSKLYRRNSHGVSTRWTWVHALLATLEALALLIPAATARSRIDPGTDLSIEERLAMMQEARRPRRVDLEVEAQGRKDTRGNLFHEDSRGRLRFESELDLDPNLKVPPERARDRAQKRSRASDRGYQMRDQGRARRNEVRARSHVQSGADPDEFGFYFDAAIQTRSRSGRTRDFLGARGNSFRGRGQDRQW